MTAAPMSAGIAIVSPASSSAIANRVPVHRQGEVMGATSGLNSLSRIFGPLMAGFLYGYSITIHFTISFIVIVIIIMANYFRFNPQISPKDSIRIATDQ